MSQYFFLNEALFKKKKKYMISKKDLKTNKVNIKDPEVFDTVGEAISDLSENLARQVFKSLSSMGTPKNHKTTYVFDNKYKSSFDRKPFYFYTLNAKNGSIISKDTKTVMEICEEFEVRILFTDLDKKLKTILKTKDEVKSMINNIIKVHEKNGNKYAKSIGKELVDNSEKKDGVSVSIRLDTDSFYKDMIIADHIMELSFEDLVEKLDDGSYDETEFYNVTHAMSDEINSKYGSEKGDKYVSITEAYGYHAYSVAVKL